MNEKELSKYNPTTEFLLYKTPNGDIKVDVLLQNETIWMPQKTIAELFDVNVPAISKHLKNIFESGELNEEVVVSILEIPTQHGAIKEKTQTNKTKFYNLDAIIAVGYRVNSKRATQFRIWATQVLKEFVIKGYTMDVERLKNPKPIFGQDYFQEQLEKIRDIRSSERRLYQKITDIYAECSIDYEYDSETTKKFFSTVQNKLHWAITNQTAAEIIVSRADHKKEKMGLTSWKNAPKGKIRKFDVIIAKNYLSEQELKPLNRIVTMYLDYAEDQAEQGNAMTMKDWAEKLDAFLQFNQKDILHNAGKVTAAIAKSFAESEFEKYRPIQDRLFESDFDRDLRKLIEGEK
ncbi:Toxin-antitoxin system, toxin component, Fic family [Desulfamplus magnetovallimortis]|uniref:Toxin-antitoxin system, toxin component, Fic family n=1 Tax=Desulfamplus magnetovallimortis TaxID=1246637 RepID=A0A1W1HAX9_9BACT|nr:virulence RhuM family protein [Desulfamplus magnetovallimortis]SLM29651.1 Toxin-antitoxin system, toxin component, Fic family [Desulfamplus magnetovallimortis]